MVAKKDFNAPKHEYLEDVPNLQVIKAMQSLTSRGFVKTQFSWQWYYYTLTPEGLDHLREWYVIYYFYLETSVADPHLSVGPISRLHLPSEIVPATHKKAARPARPAGVRPGGGDGAYRPPRGDRPDRDDYRRREPKEEGAGAEFRPRFGGVGRGAPIS